VDQLNNSGGKTGLRMVEAHAAGAETQRIGPFEKHDEPEVRSILRLVTGRDVL
jgi:hypothetical protein